MPELPEVEDAARRLRQAALGRTIERADTFHPSLARSLTPSAQRRLAGRRIVGVERRAKIQLITLDDGALIEVHFRMTGDWAFGTTADTPPPYERVRFVCTDGTCISLTDVRAFAVVRVHAPGTFVLPMLGPEPLDDTFTADVLYAALRRTRGPIKTVLLDQRVLAGLGNIYAAEALWRARIHPARVASSIARARVATLRDAIRDALQAAPAGRYYDAGEEPRDGADDWQVYDREGLPCMRCATPVRRIVQAGRSTYYCGKCQR